MKTSIQILLVALCAAAALAAGCDLLGGGGGQQQPQAVPGFPMVPGQQIGAPAVPAVPGQQIGAPAVPAVPGQQIGAPAVPAVPGQQVGVPGMAGIPAVAQPVAAPTPVPAPTPPMPTGDMLTDRLNTAQFNRAADWKATSAMERVPVTKGEKRGYEVVLPGPPFCHTYIAVAEDGIEEFAVTVESPMATPEASAAWPPTPEDTTHTAVIAGHCPTMPGTYKVFFENKKGTGTFALQVFSKGK